MPTRQQLAQLMAQHPELSDEELLALAQQQDQPSKLRQVWDALTRPIVGEQGYLGVGLPRVNEPGIPGKVYNTAADFAEAMTSPLDVATLGAGMGARAAGKAGLMGLSKLAKAAEIAGTGSYGVAGVAQAAADPTLPNLGAGALQAGLSAFGVRGAMKGMPRVNAPLPAAAAGGVDEVTGQVLEVGGRQLPPRPSREMLQQQVAVSDDALRQTMQGQAPGPNYGRGYSAADASPALGTPETDMALQRKMLDLFGRQSDEALKINNPDAIREVKHRVMQGLETGRFRPGTPIYDEASRLAQRLDEFEQGALRGAGRTVPTPRVGDRSLEGLQARAQQTVAGLTPEKLAESQARIAASKQRLGLNQANIVVGPALALGSDPIAQMVPGLDEEQRQKLSTGLKVGGAALGAAPLAAAWANRYGGFAGKKIYNTPLGLFGTDRTTKTLATERTSALLRGAVDEFDQGLIAKGMDPETFQRVKEGSANLLEAHTKNLVAQRPMAEMMQDYHAGKGGSEWYEKVGNYFKEKLGEEDANLFARFVAATSINATVKANMTLALRAWAEHKAGLNFVKKPPTGKAKAKMLRENPAEYQAMVDAYKNRPKGQESYLSSVVDELNRAKAGQPFEGRKIENFARAILGDPNAVVIDRWMMRWAGFPAAEKWGAADDPIYDIIEDMVRKAAAEQGVTPRQMQAAIWKGTRDRLGIVEEKTGKALRKEYGGSYDELLEDPTYAKRGKWKKILQDANAGQPQQAPLFKR